MMDKGGRVRSLPFTKEESALLAELYASNMEEYEGRSKRTKSDFHEEWAKSLSENCAVATRSPKQIHQRLRDMARAARDRASAQKRAITKTGGGSPKSDRPTRSEAEITMDTAYEQSLVVHGIEGGVETGEENDEGFESDEGNEERTPDRITSSLSKARHALKEHKAADADKNDVTTLRIQLLKHEIHRSELHCELLREKLHLAQEKRQLLRQEQQHRDEIHAAQLASMGFSDVSDIVVD